MVPMVTMYMYIPLFTLSFAQAKSCLGCRPHPAEAYAHRRAWLPGTETATAHDTSPGTGADGRDGDDGTAHWGGRDVWGLFSCSAAAHCTTTKSIWHGKTDLLVYRVKMASHLKY